MWNETRRLAGMPFIRQIRRWNRNATERNFQFSLIFGWNQTSKSGAAMVCDQLSNLVNVCVHQRASEPFANRNFSPPPHFAKYSTSPSRIIEIRLSEKSMFVLILCAGIPLRVTWFFFFFWIAIIESYDISTNVLNDVDQGDIIS